MFTYFLDFLHEPSLKVEESPGTNPAWLGLKKAYISYKGVNVSEKAVCKTNDSANRSAVTDSTNVLVVFLYNTWYTGCPQIIHTILMVNKYHTIHNRCIFYLK